MDEKNGIVEAVKIYTKPLFSRYHARINEETGRLARADPSLLTRRAELLQQARDAVHEGWVHVHQRQISIY